MLKVLKIFFFFKSRYCDRCCVENSFHTATLFLTCDEIYINVPTGINIPISPLPVPGSWAWWATLYHWPSSLPHRCHVTDLHTTLKRKRRTRRRSWARPSPGHPWAWRKQWASAAWSLIWTWVREEKPGLSAAHWERWMMQKRRKRRSALWTASPSWPRGLWAIWSGSAPCHAARLLASASVHSSL